MSRHTKEKTAARALQALLGCSYSTALMKVRETARAAKAELPSPPAAPICGNFDFHITGNDQCVLPQGHPPPCVFTEHDCADCGTLHGTCRQCGTTHGDGHASNCPHLRP